MDDLEFEDFSFVQEWEAFPSNIPTLYSASPSLSMEGITTGSGSSDSESQDPAEEDLVSSKKRGHLDLEPASSNVKRSRNRPLGILGGIYVNKRSNGRTIKHIVLPRILKTDKRRGYAAMFGNVYNSGDPTMGKPKQTDVDGWDEVEKFWSSHIVSVPDLVFYLKQVRLRVRSDGTASVDFQFSMAGTYLVPEFVYEQVTSDLKKPLDVSNTFNAPQVQELSDSSLSDEDLLDGTGLSSDDSGKEAKEFGEQLAEYEATGQAMCEMHRATVMNSQYVGPTRLVPMDAQAMASMDLDTNSRVERVSFWIS